MGRAAALTFAREATFVGCDVTVEPAAETVEMVRAAGGEMISLHPLQGCQNYVCILWPAGSRISQLRRISASSGRRYRVRPKLVAIEVSG